MGDEDGSADSKTISLTTLIHRETFHQICVVALSLLLSTPVTVVVIVISLVRFVTFISRKPILDYIFIFKHIFTRDFDALVI